MQRRRQTIGNKVELVNMDGYWKIVEIMPVSYKEYLIVSNITFLKILANYNTRDPVSFLFRRLN